jgi:hypothetical protein
MIGDTNYNYKANSFISGYNNQNYGQNTLTFGTGSYNATTNGIVGRKYNAANSSNLLELGNGTSSSRSNAFEVTDTGIARAYGAPVEDNDVVRLKELNAATTLEYVTDTEIDALWA